MCYLVRNNPGQFVIGLNVIEEALVDVDKAPRQREGVYVFLVQYLERIPELRNLGAAVGGFYLCGIRCFGD